MNPTSIVLIVIATVAVCLIIMQIYYIYENYDNIKEFNSTHSTLEYSKTINVFSLDRRIYDPNDHIYDVKQKWRCVNYKNNYVSVSVFGFKSNKDKNIKMFTTINDCINYTFSKSTHSDIYNPCILDDGFQNQDCIFLKSVI
ncbi:118L [Yaba monkey tumor virus]|uniref:Envelope protein A28 homolog n=1 Tax=Yaba monkey tumor virus (strain VR587) TaxID=928314 RepID=A28_YMTV5|nr:118L [Yaba monkey tumor virus]P60672.1 RecName: Full=Envelope protein A28 homolog; AltName: Full=Protein 118 [Yaba monkey tumor virus strain VR587]AAR07474.1 118L [Yaba monkey tumor virus]